MKRIKLYFVDDHQMLIDGLKALLSSEENFEYLGEANHAAKALKDLETLSPDILVADINMPEISGIELTAKVRHLYPAVKVLALSMYNEKGMIAEMLKAGVSGYILKNTGKEELCTALKEIADGKTYFGREVAAEMMGALAAQQRDSMEQSSPLTTREREIIGLIAKEYSNAQIAEALFISERTVETHRKNIFRKTNTKGLVGLIKYAYEHKLIE